MSSPLQRIDEHRVERDLGYRFGYVADFMGFGPEDIEAIHGLAPYWIANDVFGGEDKGNLRRSNAGGGGQAGFTH